MKKINIACASILLVIIAIFSMMIYMTSEQPQYYNNGYGTLQSLSLYDPDDSGRDTTTKVKEEYKEYVLEIFEDLSQRYDVEKSNPNVAYFHPHDNISAQYSKGYIYINFMEYNTIEDAKASIAHELTHYFSDDGQLFGFLYTIDDTYIFGCNFNEGVTNYFSTQYASNTNYQFETHVAKLIALCYGEETLAHDFFSADVSNLRNDFNNSVQKYYKTESYDTLTLTPFDAMTSFLNTYGQTSDDSLRINQMLAVDEMLLYYAKQKGCENEVREEILNFATINDLSYLTKVL